MSRHVLTRSTTIVLGRQDERSFRRSARGRGLWERTEGGATFASLFPDLVGQALTITNQGLELAGNPRMIQCCQWLTANGYL